MKSENFNDKAKVVCVGDKILSRFNISNFSPCDN